MGRHLLRAAVAFVAVFLLMLLWDVGRTYFLRKRVEFAVRSAAEEIARAHLPYRPDRAVREGYEALEARGLLPDANSIVVSPGGDSMTVSATGEATAYMAWIFGFRTFTFRAAAHASVRTPNARPAGALPADSVAFFVEVPPSSPSSPPSDFQLDAPVALWPTDEAVPEYGIGVYAARSDPGDGIWEAGEAVDLVPLENLSPWAERPVYVAMVANARTGAGRIAGFAFFEAWSLDGAGRLRGTFRRHGIHPKEGEPWGRGGGASFGLFFGDPPQYYVRGV